jgi:hypothetical protein
MVTFFWTIPLMGLAVLAAFVPLVVVSRREFAELLHEAEIRFARHHAKRPRRHRMAGRSPRAAMRPQSEEPTPSRQRAWHQPLLLQHRSRIDERSET